MRRTSRQDRAEEAHRISRRERAEAMPNMNSRISCKSMMMNCRSDKREAVKVDTLEILALLVFILHVLAHCWPWIVGGLAGLLVLGLIVGRCEK